MEKQITVTLDVQGLTIDAIRSQVHQHIYEHRDVDELVRDAVRGEVEKLAGKIATEEIRRRIAAAIDDVFATGWRKTDEYGREQGKVETVKDMILGYLKSSDRYSSAGQWIEKATREAFNAYFSKEIEPEVRAAKQRFKEMLDSTIHDRLATALREAMGLSAK
jgi:hypothetical protein